MSAGEQLWFLIGIGGFLLFLEGAIALLVRLIAERLHRTVRVETVQIIVGLIIFVLALVYLIRLPSA